MSNAELSLLAYTLDRLFGEFTLFKHPVIRIGELIAWFEKRFYRDTVAAGALLVLFMLILAASASLLLDALLKSAPDWIGMVLLGMTASMFLAHTMLHDSVAELLVAPNKREKLAHLVSRDTEGLNESSIYKAGIETYAENLSDGVVAPLFYLLLWGLPGVILYKTVNTLDSMVGYKTPRYTNFGKAAARLDDLANYLPARITAVVIILFSKGGIRFWDNGHESPNAGQPITAMALALRVRLGGPASYHGRLKEKPYFGGYSRDPNADDLKKALLFSQRFDRIIIVSLSFILLIKGIL